VDPDSGRAHLTRDVIWLRRMFYTIQEHIDPEIAITPAKANDDLYIDTNEAESGARAGERIAPTAVPPAPNAEVPLDAIKI
jgi:hypothetical protein